MAETVVLPCLDMHPQKSEPVKRNPLLLPLEDGDEEVLASGGGGMMDANSLMRAPMPMKQVLQIEAASGSQQGTYFVELMRRRLQGLMMVQEKWITRLCNQKHAKHVDTQVRIRNFMRGVLQSYDEQFGAPNTNAVLSAAPVRHRRRRDASPK
jgi:hypothetical protein